MSDAGPDADDTDVVIDAGGGPHPLPDGGPAPTWSTLYASYFGPATIGHCGNSGCHAKQNNHLWCPDKATCWQSLVDNGYVDPSDPRASTLGDPNATILSWFGTGAPMPQDSQHPNQAAVDAIEAWLYAGAKND